MEKINQALDYLEKNLPGPLAWSLGFAGIVAVRLFFDEFAAGTSSFTLTTATDIHNLLFFLLDTLLLWVLLAWLLRENPFKLRKIMLWAALLFLLPPLLDMLKTGGQIFWSPYLFGSLGELGGQFTSFFGRLPSGMVYFGTRIVAALSLALVGGLVFVKTKNVGRALIGALGTYVILFLMASFPSWATFVYYFFQGAKKITAVNAVDVVQLFSAPKLIFALAPENLRQGLAYNLNLIYFLIVLAILGALFFWGSRPKFLAMVKNARFPQLMVHAGLFLAGLGVGAWSYPQNLNANIFSIAAALDLLAAIGLAWLASVIINDIEDFGIDAVSNPARPLQEKIFTPEEYRQLGIILVILSLLGGLIVAPKMLALLALYQFLAWIYSAEPLRLKKYPLVATLISASALLLVMFLGFTLVSGDNNLHGLSWRIILLLLLSFTLVLPLKDFKDIAGDQKHGIWTVPVLFGEEKGRLINAVGVFLPFMLSVFFLNEFRLFWWALLFGSGAFLIIVNKKINPRRIFWWVLAVVAAYAMILVKIIFLK